MPSILPAFISKKNVQFASELSFAGARLFRRSVELSCKLSVVSPGLILLSKSTYFLSTMKLPNSVCSFGLSLYEIRQVNSLGTATTFTYVVFKKMSLIGVDVFNVLKGMKTFGYLHERHFWIFKGTPIFCALTAISLTSSLYGQYSDFSKAKNKYLRNIGKGKSPIGETDARCEKLKYKLINNTLKMSSTAFNISGIALLTLSSFILTPVIIPAYVLMTGSAFASFSHVVLAKIHEE
jgi:hypothetical protein